MQDWPSQPLKQILTVFPNLHHTMAILLYFTVLAMITFSGYCRMKISVSKPFAGLQETTRMTTKW